MPAEPDQRLSRSQRAALADLVRAVPPDVVAETLKHLHPERDLDPGDVDRLLREVEQGPRVADGVPSVLAFADWLAHRAGTAVGIELHRWIDATAASYRVDVQQLRALCVYTSQVQGLRWPMVPPRPSVRSDPTVASPPPSGRSDPAVPPQVRPDRRDAQPATFPGRIKLLVCRRLGGQWRDLADLFDVPGHERARFSAGFEAQDLWDWLEQRGRLGELSEGLRFLGRDDLAELLSGTD